MPFRFRYVIFLILFTMQVLNTYPKSGITGVNWLSLPCKSFFFSMSMGNVFPTAKHSFVWVLNKKYSIWKKCSSSPSVLIETRYDSFVSPWILFWWKWKFTFLNIDLSNFKYCSLLALLYFSNYRNVSLFSFHGSTKWIPLIWLN